MRRSPLRRCGPPSSSPAPRSLVSSRASSRSPRALCLSLAAQIFKIIIPAALPRIFLALRLCVGIALIVAVTVEISANTIGLGHMMMQAGQTLHPDIMLAFLVWVGVLGWGMNALMMAAQRHLFGAMLGESTG